MPINLSTFCKTLELGLESARIEQVHPIDGKRFRLRVACKKPDFGNQRLHWTRTVTPVTATWDEPRCNLLLEAIIYLLRQPSSSAQRDEILQSILLHVESLGEVYSSFELTLLDGKLVVRIYQELTIEKNGYPISALLADLLDIALPVFCTECSEFEFFLNAAARGFSPETAGHG